MVASLFASDSNDTNQRMQPQHELLCWLSGVTMSEHVACAARSYARIEQGVIIEARVASSKYNVMHAQYSE